VRARVRDPRLRPPGSRSCATLAGGEPGSAPSDHAHLIVEAKDRNSLGRGMKSLASRLAFAVNRALGRATGKVLAERYHLRILGSPRQVRNALA
jgi:hypothetical protein